MRHNHIYAMSDILQTKEKRKERKLWLWPIQGILLGPRQSTAGPHPNSAALVCPRFESTKRVPLVSPAQKIE